MYGAWIVTQSDSVIIETMQFSTSWTMCVCCCNSTPHSLWRLASRSPTDSLIHYFTISSEVNWFCPVGACVSEVDFVFASKIKKTKTGGIRNLSLDIYNVIPTKFSQTFQVYWNWACIISRQTRLLNATSQNSEVSQWKVYPGIVNSFNAKHFYIQFLENWMWMTAGFEVFMAVTINDSCHLGCNVIQSCRSLQMFWRHILLPPSWLKSDAEDGSSRLFWNLCVFISCTTSRHRSYLFCDRNELTAPRIEPFLFAHIDTKKRSSI